MIQLDLEDGGTRMRRRRPRESWSRRTAGRVRRGGADVVVRINRPIAMAVRDIEASICPDVDGIGITKADSASHVRLLDELVTELEEKRGMPTGHTKFNVDGRNRGCVLSVRTRSRGRAPSDVVDAHRRGRFRARDERPARSATRCTTPSSTW